MRYQTNNNIGFIYLAENYTNYTDSNSCRVIHFVVINKKYNAEINYIAFSAFFLAGYMTLTIL